MNLLEKSTTPLANPHARSYQQILQEEFGVAFTLFDATTGMKIASASVGSGHDRAIRCELDPREVIQVAIAGQAVVAPLSSDSFKISLVLHAAGSPVIVACGILPALAGTPAARIIEQSRLQNWSRDFSERLRLRDQLSVRVKAEEDLRTQVSGAWKVNLALGECMHRMRFNRHESRDRQRILETALQLLEIQTLLWVPGQSNTAPLIIGEAFIAPEDAARLAKDLSRNSTAKGAEPFLCNDVRESSWGARFPRIDNLLAFQVTGQAGSSWVIALNKNGKVSSRTVGATPPRVAFRNSDAALLSPFASMLEMHTRAASKVDEFRTLLVGLARSLTAAIDAKDTYTAGHSERVARLALEIGRELHLPEDDLRDTYLSGLLHDVGKIGIREAVLCKPGKLTAEEFEHIKQHVTIGYHILQDLQPIRHLLPGVLYHHERFDGKGYPEGLAGDKIPSLARLLAVADAFDAMNSNRPYRTALSHQQVFEELKKGSGTYWDPQIVAAALRCTDRLIAISERGLGESLRQAVDAALRTGDSSLLSPARTTSLFGSD